MAFDSESEPVYSVQNTTPPLPINSIEAIEFEIVSCSAAANLFRLATEHLFGQVAYTSSAQILHTIVPDNI